MGGIRAPVLDIDKIRVLQGFILVVRDRRPLREFSIQLIVFRMGDHKVRLTPCIDPLGKTIGDSLWKSLYMRRPGEHDLRLAASPGSRGASSTLQNLIDSYDVGQTLQRVYR